MKNPKFNRLGEAGIFIFSLFFLKYIFNLAYGQNPLDSFALSKNASEPNLAYFFRLFIFLSACCGLIEFLTSALKKIIPFVAENSMMPFIRSL